MSKRFRGRKSHSSIIVPTRAIEDFTPKVQLSEKKFELYLRGSIYYCLIEVNRCEVNIQVV